MHRTCLAAARDQANPAARRAAGHATDHAARRATHRAATLLLLVLLATGCSRPGPKEEAGGAPAETVPVTVEVVTPRPAELTLRLPGTLRAWSTVSLNPEISGRIESVRADRSDAVRRGQVLAELDDESFRLGYDQAKAAAALARAAHENAEATLRRLEPLHAEKLSSDAAWDAARTGRDVARAQMDQAVAAEGLARWTLENTRLKSPLDGFVAARMVEVGSLVSPADPAYVVMQLDPMLLNLAVSGSDATRIERGARVDVHVDARPDSVFSGVVEDVGVAADPAGGSFPVRVRVANPRHLLKDGMTATARIVVGRVVQAIQLRADVPMQRMGRWTAFVLEGGVARERVLALRDEAGTDWIVQSGLEAGDSLVVTGQTFLREGVRVRVAAGPGAPEDGR